MWLASWLTVRTLSTHAITASHREKGTFNLIGNGWSDRISLQCRKSFSFGMLFWKFYNMKYMLKVDRYFISMFYKLRCLYEENTNSVFLVTTLFLNFLLVAIGHWLKFELSIFRKRGRLVIFEDCMVLVWNSSRMFLSPSNVERCKFCAKGIVCVCVCFFCTMLGTRSLQVKPFV